MGKHLILQKIFVGHSSNKGAAFEKYMYLQIRAYVLEQIATGK